MTEKFNFETRGSGETTLVCIHGWGSDLHAFDKLAHQLEDDFTLILLDLPGFGQTNKEQNSYTMLEYAEVIRDFLDERGINPDAIIGHSMGGQIAIRGISESILKADKLVLVGAAGIRTPRSPVKRLITAITKLGKTLTLVLPRKARVKIQRRLYERLGTTDYLDAGDMRPTYLNAIHDDVREQAARLDIPTLLVYGDRDTSTPLAIAREFNRIIPSSKLEIIPQTTHYVHQDNPRLVSKYIKEFL